MSKIKVDLDIQNNSDIQFIYQSKSVIIQQKFKPNISVIIQQKLKPNISVIINWNLKASTEHSICKVFDIINIENNIYYQIGSRLPHFLENIYTTVPPHHKDYQNTWGFRLLDSYSSSYWRGGRGK